MIFFFFEILIENFTYIVVFELLLNLSTEA